VSATGLLVQNREAARLARPGPAVRKDHEGRRWPGRTGPGTSPP